MKQEIGIFGAGGFGREVLPLARSSFPEAEVFFLDDRVSGELNGVRAISFEQFTLKVTEGSNAVIAVADGLARKRIADRCAAAGIALANIKSPEVVKYDDVDMGDGAILCAGTILTSNIRIGRGFHSNLQSYVAHDCVIGDWVTFAPAVRCNGNVTIGDHAYIGTGAIIKQGVTIGAGAVVGMGAVVTKDVAPGITVVGNPAKQLIKG